MALYQAVQCKYPGPVQPLLNSDGANDLIPLIGDFTVPAGLVTGDVVEMTGIPAGYVPVDLVIHYDALATAVTLNVGVLSGNFGALLDNAGAARTCGNEALAAASFATAGIARPLKKDFGFIVPTLGDYSGAAIVTGDRGVGFGITGTLTAPVVGAKIRFTLLVRPRMEGV